jgi:hypothetical protein
MAESCTQQQERIEETVIQPLEQWVEQQEQRCHDAPCIWWMLCLNKVVCSIFTFLAKVVVWVTKVVVRWVYRLVCTLVTLVVGVLALFTGTADRLVQAVKDLWGLVKDAFYAVTGTIIFVALRIVDVVQTAAKVQAGKRKLTEDERALLFPIFRESLHYDLIEVVDGPAGILTTSGRPFTMGFTIYMPSYSKQTLVHECVHVWQFETGGFRYIGNSAFNQLDSMVFNKDYKPYDWRPRMSAGESWYQLRSVEAQASFVEDVYALGLFDFDAAETPDDHAPGAFFHEDDSGHNSFRDGETDYTEQANAAWRIVRT